MSTRISLLASLVAITSVMAQEETAVAVPATVTAEPVVATEAPAATETPAVMPAPAEPAVVVPPAPAPVETPAPAAVEVPMLNAADTAPQAVTKSKDTLSVDFPDEEIRTILRNVADLFELNLVIPDTLQGRTSLKLREVTWRQIFQVILSPIGYTFVEDGNIIKIVSQSALAEEPLTTEIFIINYAKASDIKGSIDSIVDTAVGGKVIVDARSNGLVITERSSRMGRIRPIIEKLDRATDQVMIESKFIEINAENERELGLNWAVAGGSGGGAYFSNERGSTPGTPSLSNVSTENATRIAAFPGSTVTGTPIAAGNPSAVTTSLLSGAEYTAVLRAAESKGNARVVNNPTLVTLNNVQAEINIGEEYPIPSYTYNAERGAFEVSGFEYKPIGVLLKVTPQINSQGFIKLTLEPEISQRDPIPVNFGGAGGAEIPIINTRKTKTQVSLQDGHTLGIGGLIQDQENKNVSQLPILGSIPGIGRLFQNKSNTKNRTNLLIFITARVISPKDARPEEIYDPRVLSEAKLKRSDITGYRSSADPFLPEDGAEASAAGSKK